MSIPLPHTHPNLTGERAGPRLLWRCLPAPAPRLGRLLLVLRSRGGHRSQGGVQCIALCVWVWMGVDANVGNVALSVRVPALSSIANRWR